MEFISKSTVVSFSTEQMYTVVNDVKSYPDFLPWCRASEVLEHTSQFMKASFSLAVGAVKQTFATENTLDPGKRIDVHLVSGPFKQLQGFWLFEAAGENMCRVGFQMNFEYKNLLVKLALNKIFQGIGDTLVASFIKRAEQLHAK